MSCYKPAFIKYFIDNSSGEVSAKYIGSSQHAELLAKAYDGKKHDPLNFFDSSDDKFICFQQIPCGKCIGCRIDYSRDWADRMTYHSFGKEKNSYFITLTYDDDHLDDLDHSPIYDLYALNLDHMTEFIKSLRNHFRDNSLDFYYSAEYGDNNFRPHFHLIIYNLPLDDLEFWKLDNEGQPMYTSDLIHKLWKRGLCSISSFAWLNAAYTASYVEKKRDGRMMQEYTAVGLTPESCRMSRRPGIAYDFYKEHYKEIWQNDGFFVDRTVNKSGKLGIPRYFQKLANKVYDKDGSSLGFDYFKKWRESKSDEVYLNNAEFLQNSSFDLSRVADLHKFQEREILSRQKNKKI